MLPSYNGRLQNAHNLGEFIAARQCTEQIIDLRYSLRIMSIPIQGPSIMFGDNESVIKNSTIPSSTLNKRHNALSYHRVREAIAAKILRFIKIPGSNNVADPLTKYAPHHVFWPLIEPILFWKGETGQQSASEGSSKVDSKKQVETPKIQEVRSIRKHVADLNVGWGSFCAKITTQATETLKKPQESAFFPTNRPRSLILMENSGKVHEAQTDIIISAHKGENDEFCTKATRSTDQNVRMDYL